VLFAAAALIMLAPALRGQAPRTDDLAGWSVASGFGFAFHWNRGDSDEHVLLILPAYSVMLWRRLEYFAEGHIAIYTSPAGYMLGVMPADLRFYVLSGDTRPYISAGAGLGWTNLTQLIEIDRRFNFLLQGAVGVRGQLGNGQGWSFEARLNHISNGGTKAPNLGLNTLVFVVGWHFR
jgi:hypothetical protein